MFSLTFRGSVADSKTIIFRSGSYLAGHYRSRSYLAGHYVSESDFTGHFGSGSLSDLVTDSCPIKQYFLNFCCKSSQDFCFWGRNVHKKFLFFSKSKLFCWIWRLYQCIFISMIYRIRSGHHRSRSWSNRSGHCVSGSLKEKVSDPVASGSATLSCRIRIILVRSFRTRIWGKTNKSDPCGSGSATLVRGIFWVLVVCTLIFLKDPEPLDRKLI